MVTYEPPLYQIYRHTHLLPMAQRSIAIANESKENLLEMHKTLEETLRDRPYLLGDEFSAADVLIGSIAIWAKSLGLLENRPLLLAYAHRLTERPAYQRSRAD